MNIIDLNAIEQNTKYFLNILGNAKLCAVVKNNAYGHGLVEVAHRIAPLVDMFAVGSVDEAEKISFLNKNILVLLPQNKRNTERAIRYGFALTVDSFGTLRTVNGAANSLGRIARVHIKIDSGMSRLGFTEQDVAELSAQLPISPLSVEGIFSHFYGERTADCDAQLACFERCARQLRRLFPDAVCHIANTSGALLSSKYHLDMARIGLGLYGYGDNALTPAKNVFAEVIAAKRVPAGSVVGYGAKYRCAKDSNLAVLATGYASGFPRSLIGAKIKIGEEFFPVVGVCMAMIIADVNDKQVAVGDMAQLLGGGVNIANDNVIVYELLCNF